MEDVIEVEFRDGSRWVPAHLEALFRLSGIETWTMTFQQAVESANSGLLRHHLNTAQQKTVEAHLKKDPVR